MMDLGTERSEGENNLDDFHHHMANQSLESICAEIYEVMETRIPDQKIAHQLCDKLKQYRYVSSVDHLHYGKHIRWLKQTGDTYKLCMGGVVISILESYHSGTERSEATNSMERSGGENKYLVRVLNGATQHIMQYNFEECLTFQKLTDQEILILLTKHSI